MTTDLSISIIDYEGFYLNNKILFRIINDDKHLIKESRIRINNQCCYLPYFYGICLHSEYGNGYVLSSVSGKDIDTVENNNNKRQLIAYNICKLYYYFNSRGLILNNLSLKSIIYINTNKTNINNDCIILNHLYHIQEYENNDNKLDTFNISYSFNNDECQINNLYSQSIELGLSLYKIISGQSLYKNILDYHSKTNIVFNSQESFNLIITFITNTLIQFVLFLKFSDSF